MARAACLALPPCLPPASGVRSGVRLRRRRRRGGAGPAWLGGAHAQRAGAAGACVSPAVSVAVSAGPQLPSAAAPRYNAGTPSRLHGRRQGPLQEGVPLSIRDLTQKMNQLMVSRRRHLRSPQRDSSLIILRRHWGLASWRSDTLSDFECVLCE
eukprot:scaffold33221_cov55-Phaeocystis_antarctica.AAC.3